MCVPLPTYSVLFPHARSRLPIYVHVTVQSAVIKSDSGRRNICKTRSRSSWLAFIRTRRRRRRLPDAVICVTLVRYQPCINMSLGEPISSAYICIIKRTGVTIYESMYLTIALFALRRSCDAAATRYLFPDGRTAISYRAHDRFGGPDYVKSNFCISLLRGIRDGICRSSGI